MGILQAAYRTYENHLDKVGVTEEDKETLAPVSHMFANAHIEITINEDGVFQSAATIAKKESKTIIPVALISANRTGDNDKAHPLCDQLRYLAPFGGNKFEAYRSNLEKWACSEFTHVKVRAVLRYIQRESIVHDLTAAEVISSDEFGRPGKGSIEGTSYDKCLIRWRVTSGVDGEKSGCWEDISLFQSFISYYAAELKNGATDICQITGEEDAICDMHPKGVVYANYGAKLVSANDKSNYTYRGRFVNPSQACNVGYTASQKSHHALHWIAANSGVIIGGRTFLCWNPEGKKVPQVAFWGLPSEEPKDFVSYKRQLLQTLGSYRNTLSDIDDVIIATLDAATTGRLSVTYYNEFKAFDFLNRIENWFITCCWDARYYGVQSPTLKQIVDCAFGTLRNGYLETDSKLMRDYTQRLIHCMVSQQSIPTNIVQAMISKAGNLQIYPASLRERLLITVCAVIRKYRNDRSRKEEWTLKLDKNSTDRSYQFGRLLAIAEHVEKRTYPNDEKRETNAIRMQAVFSQRPLYAWRILEEKLNPYFKSLSPGLRNYYKNMIADVFKMIPDSNRAELGKRLDDTYLLGYYLQRSALLGKDKDNDEKENKNESVKE